MSQQDLPSPLPGTFYRSPGPGEAPFVEVGKRVAAGDIVGIIEVMKQFNQIETSVAGVVAEILVADGDPVEAGQPLLRIEG
ncbi:acetyl-CoA carboxylase [Bordetella avium]|uniref:Biotin carboxyl carrier protein of acetyl-CoA carboxylase n=1 Tax=Bordetella avium (strain 197N) TaxID=360910 RepID=Q2KTV0_BORA1|nr:acetyl-CoA carboxylase [Bordetella avium]AZY50621.1 biotin carboxyl carrier domain-containing protein [Bordetella avium]AZY54018.1 biotin carboxyl carrier domain-containing protein [Bordetella avium]RIQ15210.1 biotin carboxyl carrier domain-containing protein [Bordetella avium]RIQ19985.1 biotin carboxyl carrier domain-containing protein [Bordetella avium]RIQ34565.1 biotin carboxyl carrier domain-containing protein [Bordetella avium]